MPIFLILPLVLISVIVFVLAVFYLMIRCKRVMLNICFAFVVTGFLLYTAGYLSSGEGPADTLFATLRGIFSTVRMFSLNEDYGVLSAKQGTQWLTGNIQMQILLWLCYMSALIIIQTALITLFGRKLMDNFRLSFGPHKEVYIIKGSDRNAIMLGENIAAHDAKHKYPDNNRLIVFLLKEGDDEKKTYENAAHFGGIVQVLDRENNLLSCLKKAGLKKKEKHRICFYIILMPDDVSLSGDTRRIAEYAKKENIPHDSLDIFALTSSKWEREKIEAITQEKEDDRRKYPYTIHITNEVDIVARQMVERYPPFECLDFNEKGEAAHNFTVMILGFGAVGQQVFLRLVMNGQFAGSRMRAIIIDRDADNLRDSFLYRYQGLELSCDMEFKNFDVRRKEFFTLLNEVNDVDYVVIALYGDEINRQTALDIRLHYERKDINDLPFIAVLENDGSLCKSEQNEKIFTFGCGDDVYKESVILRAEVDRMAKTVNAVYNQKNPRRAMPWPERDWFTQESNRATADFIPAMLKLAGLDDKEVKDALAEKGSALAEILAQTEHLRWNAFHAAMGWSSISVEGMRKCFADTKDMDLCRKNPMKRLHVCLAQWDKLDEISQAYSEITQKEEDFKEYDREIIENIPLFLKKAEET